MGLRLPRFKKMAMPSMMIWLGALLGSSPLAAAAIPVRFAEGAIHGFLVLRTQEGKVLAQGDLLQVGRGAEIHKTMVFRFEDGSLFKETVVFTQMGAYTLQNYQLEQRGPVFTEDTRISLERSSGKYRVETEARQGGPAKVLEGSLDFPPDLYNGMISTVVKDLPTGARETVHFVAFTPAPRVIQLEIAPAGQRDMKVGEAVVIAAHYTLKPRLGLWLKFFAGLLGRKLQDGHVWIIEGEVPAFVGFEGQLYTTDPVWLVELVSPTRFTPGKQ